ncbi:pyridoxal-dependent decarboxylase domain-containing protein 1 [Phlebotomus argentipes]|uniref:pyridoxal-dependent decarboxylase domain-containing protein 1 n=1 Tax=Phlebotomus argentipes TaxID=94469 RepID=UPI0028933B1A|nr:pyridoxal-dependent decarboxylase domain-containing protein 1 [Phlebotomus argentipes]
MAEQDVTSLPEQPPAEKSEAQQTDHVAEIPASTVRSGLVELENRATQLIQSMENLKTSPEATGGTPAAPQTPVAGFLPPERRDAAEIVAGLETLICTTDTDVEPEYSLPPLNDVSQLALISHSFVAYLSHLRRSQLLRVTTKIASDTNRWLSHIFRFSDSSTSYHNDSTECVLRAVRLAIVARCPGYLEAGIQALANPCMYVTENSGLVALQYACRQLGLPAECIRVVPSTAGSMGTMDVATLQRLIATDVANKRVPLFVIANVGASVCGFVDNVPKLYDVCRTANVWLHCRGHSLAALATAQGSGDVRELCDSMSLSLGSWLAVPSLPVVLLHRQIQNVALSVFESDPIVSRRLNSLTLWTTLQALGRDLISDRILMAFESVRVVYEILSKCAGVRILSKKPGGDSGISVVDLVHEPLNASLLFEISVSVVVFQFHQKSPETDTETAVQGEHVEKSRYLDRMNEWLGEIIQRDCPGVDLEIIDHAVYGTAIRFCPFEMSLGEAVPTIEYLEHFAACLDLQVGILKATERHKVTFQEIVKRSDVLRLISLPDWAGLGGVRFVPDGWETLLTDQAKTELNKLNTDLVEALRSTDSAFTLGEGEDGLICVKLGMVTEETDVEELLEVVISVGKSVQENSRVLDSMSEIVKKGIETVTADLQRESDEKLWQDGILRHVPIVGSVFNWWSPPPKETGIKGRSLNLTQGVVESTENIYKYHMQIAGGSIPIPGNRSPPTPMVQTSVSAGHSRNVSQSSGTSTNVQEAQH